MKKLNDYAAAAAEAVTDLTKKLDAAEAEAEKAKAEAELKLGTRQQVIEIITKAIQGSSSDAANIVNSYAQILNIQKPTAKLLIQGLVSAVDRHGLSHKQAGQIAKAIMSHVQGNAPAGLLDWPDVDGWAELLHDKALRAWAAWVDPDAFRLLEKAEAKASEDYAKAEVAILRLERARAALGDIEIPADKPEHVLIRNNSERQVGLSGLDIAAGEIQPINFQEYAGLMHHQGFQTMRKQNTLEVLA